MTKEKPLISVICPVYNVEKYIERSINSIINNTYKNLEIILVNDGSTDNSLELCRKFERKDKRIKVIDKENGGASSARNAGLEACHGTYISFIDPDDVIEPNFYELLLKNILTNKSDISICNYRYVDEKYKELSNKKNNYLTKEILTKEEALERLYTKNRERMVVVCTKLYSSKLFKNVKFLENVKVNEDDYFSFDILYACNKVSIINNVLYNYVQREKSTMHSPTFKEIYKKEVLKAYIYRNKKIKCLNNVSLMELNQEDMLSAYLDLKKNHIEDVKLFSIFKNEYFSFNKNWNFKNLFKYLFPGLYFDLKGGNNRNG